MKMNNGETHKNFILEVLPGSDLVLNPHNLHCFCTVHFCGNVSLKPKSKSNCFIANDICEYCKTFHTTFNVALSKYIPLKELFRHIRVETNSYLQHKTAHVSAGWAQSCCNRAAAAKTCFAPSHPWLNVGVSVVTKSPEAPSHKAS